MLSGNTMPLSIAAKVLQQATITQLAKDPFTPQGWKIALDRAKLKDDTLRPVGSYRGFEISVYADRFSALCFRVSGAGEFESDNLRYNADEKFSATGFLTRIDNYLGTFEWRSREAEDLRSRELSELAKAKQELLKPFAQMAQLEDLRADVRDVMAELQRIQADENYVSTWRPRSASHDAAEHKPKKQLDAFTPPMRAGPVAA